MSWLVPPLVVLAAALALLSAAVRRREAAVLLASEEGRSRLHRCLGALARPSGGKPSSPPASEPRSESVAGPTDRPRPAVPVPSRAPAGLHASVPS